MAFGRKIALAALLAAMVCAAALAGADSGLTRFEYAEFGGMENASLNLTLAADASGGGAALTVARRIGDRTTTETFPVPRRALDELDAFLCANCPPGEWASLPESEIIALDAPIRRLEATYDGGETYAVDDDRELPETSEPLFWAAQWFLESYAARDARTFEVRFSSFGGSGMTCQPVLSAPEKLDWSSRVDDFGAGEPTPPGSPCDEVFTFRGRVPGAVDVWFEVSSPLDPAPVGGEPVAPMVYHLTVDTDYNVTCEEDAE